jgi:hypothetical protein
LVGQKESGGASHRRFLFVALEKVVSSDSQFGNLNELILDANPEKLPTPLSILLKMTTSSPNELLLWF